MNKRILTILYEMAMTIGGEVRVKPLLSKTLQQLLCRTVGKIGVPAEILSKRGCSTIPSGGRRLPELLEEGFEFS